MQTQVPRLLLKPPKGFPKEVVNVPIELLLKYPEPPVVAAAVAVAAAAEVVVELAAELVVVAVAVAVVAVAAPVELAELVLQ